MARHESFLIKFDYVVFNAHCIQEGQEEFDIELYNQFKARITIEDFDLALHQYGHQASFWIEIKLSKKRQADCILVEVRISFFYFFE